MSGPLTSPAPCDDLVALLHARGGRATPQRLVILRELRRAGQHVTAEEIGRTVRADLPGISMPTVYATLELLVELGLARRVDAGGAAIYDPRLEPHQHASCRRCGRLEDIDCDLDSPALLDAAAAGGFVGRSVELVISGLCAGCATLARERPAG